MALRTFVSWSGERGRLVAEAVCEWLPFVLPNLQPWMSTQIRRGSTWSNELLNSLSEARSCIICVTSASVGSSWLAFEGGVLVAHSRQVPVVCLCLDVDPAALIGTPLALFRPSVLFGPAGMRELVAVLNRTMQPPISTAVLERFFNQSWDNLESRIAKIPPSSVSKFDLVFWTAKNTLFTVEDLPLADGPWSEELVRIVESAGGRVGVDSSELAQFRYVDLAANRWMQPPLKISDIRTDRFVMVHASIVAGYEQQIGAGQGSARAIAFLVKNSLDVTPKLLRASELLKRDMKCLAVAQGEFREKNGRYSRDLAGIGFYPAPGATIEIAAAGANGWSAVVTHDLLPDYFAFRIGDGGGQFATAEEGLLVKVSRSP